MFSLWGGVGVVKRCTARVERKKTRFSAVHVVHVTPLSKSELLSIAQRRYFEEKFSHPCRKEAEAMPVGSGEAVPLRGSGSALIETDTIDEGLQLLLDGSPAVVFEAGTDYVLPEGIDAKAAMNTVRQTVVNYVKKHTGRLSATRAVKDGSEVVGFRLSWYEAD